MSDNYTVWDLKQAIADFDDSAPIEMCIHLDAYPARERDVSMILDTSTITKVDNKNPKVTLIFKQKAK